MDRSDEVRGGGGSRGSGGPTITAAPEVAGRLLCGTTHPMALELGTIPPGFRCCENCVLYPEDAPIADRSSVMLVHQHRTYVQTIGRDARAFFAVCSSCGWMGPDRADRAEAEGDGQAHSEPTGIEVWPGR